MKIVSGLVMLAFLASCGVEGAPLKPTLSTGITVGPNGVSTSTKIGASKGPVSVSVGL